MNPERVKTFREEQAELIQACRNGHGTLYGQDVLAEVVAALADECENRERNERAEISRSEEYAEAYRDAEAELSKVKPVLREIATTARWYADNGQRLAYEVDHALCVEILATAEKALDPTPCRVQFALDSLGDVLEPRG